MKSYYGGPIGTHQCSFKRYHPRALTGSPSPRLGVRNPQTAIAIMSGMGKATDCKFGCYVHRVHLNKSPLIIWEKRECG